MQLLLPGDGFVYGSLFLSRFSPVNSRILGVGGFLFFFFFAWVSFLPALWASVSWGFFNPTLVRQKLQQD